MKIKQENISLIYDILHLNELIHLRECRYFIIIIIIILKKFLLLFCIYFKNFEFV